MARTDYKSVDQYIAAQPEEVRGTLERVRGIIRKALPRAEEVISYQIPAYRQPRGIVLYFAGWKQHYSLYPAGESMVAAFRDELAGCELSHKGTIRFPLAKPVPVGLITRLARFRAREVADRADAKAAAKAARSKTKPKPKARAKAAAKKR
jgi:uncharacterized protein YdhG (YjbR/CyaY superfamily)